MQGVCGMRDGGESDVGSALKDSNLQEETSEEGEVTSSRSHCESTKQEATEMGRKARGTSRRAEKFGGWWRRLCGLR